MSAPKRVRRPTTRRKVRKPRDLVFWGRTAAQCAVDDSGERPGHRWINITPQNVHNATLTAAIVAWLQRALAWQREGERCR